MPIPLPQTTQNPLPNLDLPMCNNNLASDDGGGRRGIARCDNAAPRQRAQTARARWRHGMRGYGVALAWRGDGRGGSCCNDIAGEKWRRGGIIVKIIVSIISAATINNGNIFP